MTNQDIVTAQQASESDMRAIQNMFERAANAIVKASNLGQEVADLRTQVDAMVADTTRLREHIQWLEQENQTLRTQRDEAQNSLSDVRLDLDKWIADHKAVTNDLQSASYQRDQARQDATTWENLANETSQALQLAQDTIAKLEHMVKSVWMEVRNHFTPKPEPEIAPSSQVVSTDHFGSENPMPWSNETKQPDHQPEPPMPAHEYWSNPHNHPAE